MAGIEGRRSVRVSLRCRTGVIFLIILFALSTRFAVSTYLACGIADAQRDRRYDVADQRLSWLRLFAGETSETLILESRQARKVNDLQFVSMYLQRALAAGADPERVRLEYLLLESQCGRIETLGSELPLHLQRFPEHAAEICEAYANGALITGRLELATRVIREWQRQFPEDPQSFYAMARVLEFQQETAAAVVELRRALRLQAQHWPAMYLAAELLISEQLQEEALQVLSAGLEEEWHTAIQLQLARCLDLMGDESAARSILLRLAQHSDQQRQRSYSLVQEQPEGNPIDFELGRMEFARGEVKGAIACFDSVLRESPNHLEAMYLRGLCLLESGAVMDGERDLKHVSRAREQLQEIDRLADELKKESTDQHVAIRCRIGELFLMHDSARKGVFWLKDALNHDPGYQPAHRLLARYYGELARSDSQWQDAADFHSTRSGLSASDEKTPPDHADAESPLP